MNRTTLVVLVVGAVAVAAYAMTAKAQAAVSEQEPPKRQGYPVLFENNDDSIDLDRLVGIGAKIGGMFA